MTDIIESVKLALKLERVVKAMKFMYGDRWETIKNETVAVIKEYQPKTGKDSLLAAALYMAQHADSDEKQILLLAAAADYKE